MNYYKGVISNLIGDLLSGTISNTSTSKGQPNPRLLNIVERTLWYKFNLVHIPGEDNSGPDFFSMYIRPIFQAPQLVGEALSVSTPSSCQPREKAPSQVDPRRET